MDILYIDYSKNTFVVDLKKKRKKKSLCCNWLAKHMNVQKINTKCWQPKQHSKVCYERNNSELRLMTLISLIPNCAVSSCVMCSVKLMHRFTLIYFSNPSSHCQGAALWARGSLNYHLTHHRDQKPHLMCRKTTECTACFNCPSEEHMMMSLPVELFFWFWWVNILGCETFILFQVHFLWSLSGRWHQEVQDFCWLPQEEMPRQKEEGILIAPIIYHAAFNNMLLVNHTSSNIKYR